MNLAFPTTDRASPLARICLGSGLVVHVEVTDRMEDAEPAWRQLCGPDSLATAYQNYDFCALWFRHVGEPSGARPLIVVGRNDAGQPVFVWPLVRRVTTYGTVATFFCGNHANFHTTLWCANAAAGVRKQDLRAILKSVASRDVDVLTLLNQPEQWNGIANPLRRLSHQPSPDQTYGVTLRGTGEEIIARHLTPDTRRKFRRKERHLAKLPGYRYVRASTAADVDRYIAEFMTQKAARLSDRGIKNAFHEPGVVEFLRAACLHGLTEGHPLIEIHALDSDTEVLALFSGIHDTRCFSTMFNSYTLSEHARWSPGYTLLLKMIDDCAKRGFDSLNLGIGSAEYKASICDIEGPQFDNIIALTWRGTLYATALRAAYSLKRFIKRRPALASRLHSLRAQMNARSQRS